MKADQTNIQELWDLFVSDKATEQQVNALFEYIKNRDDDEEHIAFFKEAVGKVPRPLYNTEDAVVQSILDAIIASNEDLREPLQHQEANAPRIPFYRRWWTAASIILLLSAGIYFWVRSTGKTQKVATVQNEAVPGSNRAVLTLADGRTIILDSSADGSLAMQGNTTIVKLASGQIAYANNGAAGSELLYNTMTTPRGGQYQLRLPDGTRVWLNAASSISFPVAFTGKERKVSITGEAYFEVAKNKEKPFIVDVNNKLNVEVLGTHFNINSYPEESAIKTTLLEGKVQVQSAIGSRQSAMLKPGQQAVFIADSRLPIHDSRLTIHNRVDLDQVLAWKNGLFDFQDMRFAEAMRQVERWYDIQVVYEGQAPDIEFTGGMDRGVQLSGIIRFLNDYGITTRIEGRQLIISKP